MVTPTTGAVILVPFPFSDLSQAKMRPAVVLADAGRGDWIFCQVTSNPYGDSQSISLPESGFVSGSLRIASYARPGKLFTASQALMASNVGILQGDTLKKIVDAVVDILHKNFK
jgi:mRNA interferase MazF